MSGLTVTTTAPAADQTATPSTPAGRALWLSGVLLLFALAVVALLAPLTGSPYRIHAEPLTADGLPGGLGTPGHPFGTDALGRDTLSRATYGLRSTLIIAVIASPRWCWARWSGFWPGSAADGSISF
ncbi:hypothetical protein ACFYM7_30080 [Streptomyces cyaneofuscatus]|uniref:hypothetical protein n=1 Tax=Streptomyces cyaneofuscatus TaxID=66883 RepID=UPI00368E2461